MKYFIAIALLITVFTNVVAQDTTRISLLFAGDVMGHDSQIASAYEPSTNSYDYSSCFQFIKPYVEQADLAITNLEVTLAGRPYKGYPQFSSPDALAVTLKEIGFDALVTANNHCVDRGKKGLQRTIRVLDSLNIPHTGTFVDSAARRSSNPLMLYKNGFSIALLNYTYGTNGLPVHKPNIVNMLDPQVIRRDIEYAKKSSPDIIIVFTHWGAEYQSLPSQAQKDLTDLCFRHGAKLVIGAHPHVIQPMEWRKAEDKFVAYSLGNFVSGQRKRYTDGGSLAYLELEKIAFSPDSSLTRIDSAGYYLAWVHRTPDSKKDYYLLPAPDHESNLSFIRSADAQGAYKQFLEDSRALSRKYNKGAGEITSAARKDDITYRVVLLKTAAGEDPWKILTDQQEYLWGVDRYDMPSGREVLWTSGKFQTYSAAEQYRQRYLSRHKDAVVKQWKNGSPVD